MDDKTWFTFAINSSLRRDAWRRRTGHPEDRRPDVEQSGAALVFYGHSEELIHRICAEPFIGEIANDTPMWFVPCGSNTVVAPCPCFFDNTFRTMPHKAVVGVRVPGHAVQIVPLSDVFAHCFRLERITEHCHACSIEDTCLTNNLEIHLQKSGADLAAFDWPPDWERTWYLDDLVMDENPLGAYLRKMVNPAAPFRYTTPRNTVDHPFSPGFVCASEVVFNEKELIANQSRASIAAKQAAITRKALKRCRTECCFYGYCERSSESYGGRYWGDPGKCQGQTPKHNYHGPIALIPGPFSEDQFAPAFNRWWQGHNTLSREQIAFIARNAGREVKLWDCTLVLGRCTTGLDDVIFFQTTGRGPGIEDPIFTWDETMTLLHTPVRKSDGTYQRVALRDAPEMSWEALHLYAELCQHSNLSPYNYADQEIAWYNGAFDVTARHPRRRDYVHDFRVESLKRVVDLRKEFGALPSIFANNVTPLEKKEEN